MICSPILKLDSWLSFLKSLFARDLSCAYYADDRIASFGGFIVK